MAEVFDFGLQKHKIKMDGKFFENNLFAVAGDTGRRLEVQLLDSNNMVQNTTGISLRLNAVVAGQATYAEATLVDAIKGLYKLDLPNGMLLAPGNWQFQWQITDSVGKKLHSFAFTGSVGSNLSEGGSEATNFYLNAEELRLKTIELQTDFDKLGDQFKILIDETTGKDVISAPEIIAARNGEASLNARLTKNEQSTTAQFQQTTAQLAQTSKKLNEIGINVTLFGAKPIEEHPLFDSTESFVLAIEAANGGKVIVPSGTFLATVKLPSNTLLMGNGMSTVIKNPPNSNKPVISLLTENEIQVGVCDLMVDGNSSEQDVLNDSTGIHFKNNVSKYSTFGGRLHYMENVYIKNTKGHGLSLVNSTGSFRGRRIFVVDAGGNGFYIGGGDCSLIECGSGRSKEAGFHLTSPNSRYTSCKSWNSGLGGENGDGFYIVDSRVHMVNCEAQDNLRYGFNMRGIVDSLLSGCIADSNANSGFRLQAVKNSKIDGLSHNRDKQSFEEQVFQPYALEIDGGSADNNISLATRSLTVSNILGETERNTITINAQNGYLNASITSSSEISPYKGGTIRHYLTANLTVPNPVEGHKGVKLRFIFKQDLSGGKTVTFGSAYDTVGTWQPKTNGGSSSTIEFIFDGSKWIKISSAQ